MIRKSLVWRNGAMRIFRNCILIFSKALLQWRLPDLPNSNFQIIFSFGRISLKPIGLRKRGPLLFAGFSYFPVEIIHQQIPIDELISPNPDFLIFCVANGVCIQFRFIAHRKTCICWFQKNGLWLCDNFTSSNWNNN